jgi:hypothetical protein
MIAALAVATSIPPALLIEEDPEMLATMTDVLAKRGRG